MRHRTRLAGALFGVAFMVGSSPLLAADDMPIMDETVEYKPTEVGSGWYLRGDIAWNVSDQLEARMGNVDVTDHETQTLSPSIGVGYRFTDYLRGELNVSLLTSQRATFEPVGTGLDSGSARSRVWTGIANIYADLGTVAGFTPYLGGGVGVAGKEQDYSIGVAGAAEHESSTDYGIAYALQAGVAYAVSSNVSVDLGYQFTSVPDVERVFVDGANSVVFASDDVNVHQVKVGLRFELQ